MLPLNWICQHNCKNIKSKIWKTQKLKQKNPETIFIMMGGESNFKININYRAKNLKNVAGWFSFILDSGVQIPNVEKIVLGWENKSSGIRPKAMEREGSSKP